MDGAAESISRMTSDSVSGRFAYSYADTLDRDGRLVVTRSPGRTLERNAKLGTRWSQPTEGGWHHQNRVWQRRKYWCRPPLILGLSHEGKFYTCYHTNFAGTNQGFNNDSYFSSVLDVECVFVKHHFRKVDDVRFGRVRFAYSNMHEWYWGTSAMTKVEIPSEEGKYDGRQTTVTHKRRELWNVILPDGSKVENDFGYNTNHTEDPLPQITFTHTDGVLITAQTPSKLVQRFLTPEHQFRTLISLLGDYSIEVSTVHAALDPEGSTNIEVYHKRLRPRRLRKKRDAQESPVLFDHLGAERFKAVLNSWYRVYEQVKTVAHLYLSDRLSGSLELEGTFLTVMQALEAYHHLFYPSHVYMERGEYRRAIAPVLTEAIPSTAEPSLKEKLKELLRYGYEYSLKKKLEEIILELPDDTLRNDVQAPGFLGRSVTTRNYLVHRDPEAAAKAFDQHELYRAGCVWQEVIYALVLGRAGLQPSEITRAGKMMRWKRGTLYLSAAE